MSTFSLCKDCFPKIESHYEIVGYLGGGSFGNAYHVKIKDPIFQMEDNNFAMKEIDTNGNKILKSLSEIFHSRHENCVSFAHGFFSTHDANFLTGHTYILMEKCYEKTLNTWITENRFTQTRPIDEMKKWIWQLFCAISYLHDNNVIHRDLKPDNIFFKNEANYRFGGTLKIGDFGLIKRFYDPKIKGEGGATAGHLRSPNDEYGSEFYSAPELNKKKKYNCKVDVFSLGLIAGELIWAFQNKEELQMKKAIIDREERTLKLYFRDEKVLKFITDATKPNQEERPFAKNLLQHEFFEGVSKEEGITQNLLASLQRALDQYEFQPETNPCIVLENSRPVRLIICGEKLNPMEEVDFNKSEDIVTNILVAQKALTGQYEAVFAKKDIQLHTNYLRDLLSYEKCLRNQRLVVFALEKYSVEDVKDSYRLGHVKLIPSFNVWRMEGCAEYMHSVLDGDHTNRKIEFTHSDQPKIWIPREADVDWNENKNTQKEIEDGLENSTQTELKEQLRNVINAVLPANKEMLIRRIESIKKVLKLKVEDFSETSSDDYKRIKSYCRLLLGACVFIQEKLNNSHTIKPSMCEKLTTLTSYFRLSHSVVLPTFKLFQTEPIAHWESWMEVVWSAWTPCPVTVVMDDSDEEFDDEPDSSTPNIDFDPIEVMKAFGITDVIHI